MADSTETQELQAAAGSVPEPQAGGREPDLPQGDLAYRMSHPAPNLLPGELRAHPDPWQYVVVAVVLAVITAVEIAVSYTEGDLPDGLIVVLLLAMMVVKFFLVASWFMHLRTDQPIFKRFFIVGAVAAPVLFLIVLATLHGVLAS
jgi:cytochrome c oxidase subunit 4